VGNDKVTDRRYKLFCRPGLREESRHLRENLYTLAQWMQADGVVDSSVFQFTRVRHVVGVERAHLSALQCEQGDGARLLVPSLFRGCFFVVYPAALSVIPNSGLDPSKGLTPQSII